MIFDLLSECEPYRRLSENFAAGFDYLRSNSFETMPDGRYTIRGDDVFVIIKTHQTKPQSQGRWEAHRHYADIQLIVSGSETMGIAPISTMSVQQPYSRDSDLEFFIGTGQFIRVDRGSFALFLPHDVHMPDLCVDAPAQVRKA